MKLLDDIFGKGDVVEWDGMIRGEKRLYVEDVHEI